MPLVGTYAEVEIGALLALVGSSGTVEVSQRDGDAAASLGAGAGASVVIRPSASD
jgi:S-adenosylmethionine hydrolase